MSRYDDSQKGLVPPMKDKGNYTPELMSATGTAEGSNSKPFSSDRIYTLVADADVRLIFGAAAGTGSDLGASEGAIIPGSFEFRFRAGPSARYVYFEKADGTGTVNVSVWQRET